MKEEKEIQKKKSFFNKKVIIAIVIVLILAVGAVGVYKKRDVLFPDYNSKYKLELMSVYGDNEAYHPKVVAFDEEWNHYRYWMSYTPYPDSDASKENPHIAASNDLVHWETPEGFQNPLDENVTNKNPNQYNSDSHLVINTDLNRLECYWRYVDDDANKAIVYRRCTTDGVHWTEKEVVIQSDNRKEKDFVSPAIIYEDGIYKVWYIDKGNIVKYAEAKDNEPWKDVKTIKMTYAEKLSSWHLDVIRTDLGYEMLMMAYTNIPERGKASLYHTTSEDNTTWKECTKIISPKPKTRQWDNRGIYRSCMIKQDGIYYVFYSASNKKNIKGVGIMYGKDINHLNKVNIDYKNDKKAAEKFQRLIEKEKAK